MKIVVASFEALKHPRALKLCRTLRNLGYNVYLWYAPTINIKNRYLRAFFRYISSMFSVALTDADLMWIENVPDIVYALVPIVKKNYVYDWRSPWALQVNMEFNNKYLGFIASVFERYLIKRARVIVCVSQGLYQDSLIYRKKVFILPNYPSKQLLSYKYIDFRKQFRVPPDRKIVLYIGKLSSVEGTHLLEDVASKLRGLNAELWIVGDGPARHVIKNIVREYGDLVRWFGWVSHKLIPSFIRAADIGIVPRTGIPDYARKYYSHEGIHKITEFFLFGKPVVACGISPSEYYIVVPEAKFGEYVRMAVEGKIKLIEPPMLTWEEHCVPIIKNIMDFLVR